MQKKSFLIILLAFLCFNCNNTEKSKEDKTQISENIEEQKNLSVNFSFKTSKADEFKIMMNNIEVDELQTKHIHITENVIPSTSNEVIEANFDPNNLSKQIVLHLGNKTEKSVTINRLLISYGDNFFDLNSAQDFNKHLVFNKFIIRDSTSNKLSTKRIDGKLNPTIRIKNSLINQLQR